MRVCIIVDAVSTGESISPAFKGYGYPSIHIQSSARLPQKIVNKVKPHDFIKMLVYQDDINALVEALKPYEIMCCVPGSESGVKLADLISEKLGLSTTNGTAFSEARRDKYEMIERVAKAGLKTVKHFKSSNWDAMEKEIKAWGEYPVVLKALASANGNNVYICKDLKAAKNAFSLILKSLNVFDESNTDVLLESYNPGQEYIINTISVSGKHSMTEAWRVNKIPGTIIYDTCEILQKDDPEYSAIEQYTGGVLTALHIKFGAATTELKCKKNNISTNETSSKLIWEPVLIECGARVMSATNLAFSTQMFGFNQVSLLAESYFAPDYFLHKMSNIPLRKNYGLAVLLISHKEGKLAQDLDLTPIRKLKSYHSEDITVFKGRQLSKTIDNATCPGAIYLMSPDKSQLLQDCDAIRKLEKTVLYTNVLNTTSLVPLMRMHGLSANWGLNSTPPRRTSPLNASLPICIDANRWDPEFRNTPAPY